MGYIFIAVIEEKKAQLISAAIEFICGSSCTVQETEVNKILKNKD